MREVGVCDLEGRERRAIALGQLDPEPDDLFAAHRARARNTTGVESGRARAVPGGRLEQRSRRAGRSGEVRGHPRLAAWTVARAPRRRRHRPGHPVRGRGLRQAGAGTRGRGAPVVPRTAPALPATESFCRALAGQLSVAVQGRFTSMRGWRCFLASVMGRPVFAARSDGAGDSRVREHEGGRRGRMGRGLGVENGGGFPPAEVMELPGPAPRPCWSCSSRPPVSPSRVHGRRRPSPRSRRRRRPPPPRC
jgi:hypothetical protein